MLNSKHKVTVRFKVSNLIVTKEPGLLGSEIESRQQQEGFLTINVECKEMDCKIDKKCL